MSYTPDANEIAAKEARRARAHRDAVAAETGVPVIPRVVGTFSLWDNLRMRKGYTPYQINHVTLDLSKPGLIIAYDESGDAEIFVPSPGSYMTFVPDREGE